ncbi:MAG: hypothetical protein IPL65_06610 [Lewinellaceae bacterium]|nr:hypothetical protein [Lewinellaceae bacterium]
MARACGYRLVCIQQTLVARGAFTIIYIPFTGINTLVQDACLALWKIQTMTNRFSISTLIAMLLIFGSCSGQKTAGEQVVTPGKESGTVASKRVNRTGTVAGTVQIILVLFL